MIVEWLMKIAVTGATGFLGHYLTRGLLAQGHQLRGWFRGKHESSNRMASAMDSVEWIRGQLGDVDATNALLTGADAVVHAAVDQPGDSFIGGEGDPTVYFQKNVLGSLCLMECAVKHSVGRFVFISSGAVHDRIVPTRSLDETHPLWPSSIYGSYKASVETLVHAYGLSGKLDCCAIRPTAIYGVAERIEDSKWFSLIRDIVAGRDVDASGGSKEVHAADVAKAVGLLLTTNQKTAGETYNCSDRLISRYEVAEIAKRITASGSRIGGTRKTAKHVMETAKLEQLGMRFGGTSVLENTIAEIVAGVKH